MKQVVFSIGSNLGDRKNNVRLALTELSAYGTFTAVSGLYESQAAGFVSNYPFFNLCAVLTCHTKTVDWKKTLLEIEEKLGRVRSEVTKDRTVDIDLLFFCPGSEEDHGLEIPHPRMSGRDFVIFPLYEIRQSISDKNWKEKIETWKKQLDKSPIVYVGSL